MPAPISKNVCDPLSYKNIVPTSTNTNFTVAESKKFVPVSFACDELTFKNTNVTYLKPQPLKKSINPKTYTSSKSQDESLSKQDLSNTDSSIEPNKITRATKSFHGKTQNVNTTAVLRRASEGLANIVTTKPGVDEGSTSQSFLPVPSNDPGNDGKRQISRFTTTPVMEVMSHPLEQILPASYPDNNQSQKKN